MNPWTVLGLKPGADRDAIRRAYAKLLKSTNPEDDPEGFMRLRQAHDAALAQLQWRQQWTEEEEAQPAPAALESSAPPEPAAAAAAAPEPAEDPQFAGEQDDLLARQEVLVMAIQAGPEGQRAAFDALLAAPALDNVVARAGVENWVAGLIAASLPASDPLVVPAIDRFGWDDLPRGSTPHGIARLLQRREEGEFVAGIARPHTDLHVGYMALSKPPGPRWLRHLGALFSAAPTQTRTILGLADGPMPGILDWLDADAVAAWRDWHSVQRLRLWMILTMFPLAAVVLVGLLEASGWPEPVQQGVGLLAWGAPFGLLAVLRWRQRWPDKWDRPEWHFTHWPLALAALPLLAALWPAVPALTPLFLLPVLAAVTWLLLAVDRLEPPALRELFPGLVRSQPAWLFLLLLIGGGPQADLGMPVRVLACAALALAWWQGGDALTWLAERRLGARAAWLPALAALGDAVLALGLAASGWPERGLALTPLALLGLLIALRAARGWWQALPAAGLAGLALLLLELLSRVDATTPGAGEALSRLVDADLLFDPTTGLPRAPVITAVLIAAVAIWQDRKSGGSPWPQRFLIIVACLFLILRPLVDGQPAPTATAKPPTEETRHGPPKPTGDRATWVQLPPADDTAPGRYKLEARLQVGPDGRVAGCRLEKPSGVKPVDLTACFQLMARGRYTPARDIKGQPVAAVEFYGLEWTVKPVPGRVVPLAPPPLPAPAPAIVCAPPATSTGPMVAEPCMADDWIADGSYPQGPLQRGESGLVRYRLFVDTGGRVERCAITGSSGHAGLDRDTCALLSRRARFVPARNIDGSPMVWEYDGAVRWALADR
ncbi:TonB family protein [Sandarakinorhabdus sp. AAP62]|uniref:TonB family protein n=1 Tax=Sandarakinorhabdus sp. AAP62 TaxID=1248916 RepID=UPI000308B940|nr:TonB family protein [Sandarakinorhabdus sp. AAP62]